MAYALVSIPHTAEGSATVNVTSIADGKVGAFTFTAKGAKVGGFVHVSPPAAGIATNVYLVGARISAADTVSIAVLNVSGAPAVPGNTVFTWFLH